jgi:hypothetical protein
MTLPIPANFYGDGEYLYAYDQTNPLVWQSQNPDVDESVLRLSGLLWQSVEKIRWYDAYYEGEQPISYMSKAMASELGPTLRSVVLNWCRWLSMRTPPG